MLISPIAFQGFRNFTFIFLAILLSIVSQFDGISFSLYNRLDDETKSAIRAVIREKYNIPADQPLTYDVLEQIGNDLNLVHEPFLMEEIGAFKFLYHPGVDRNQDGKVNYDDRYQVSVNGYLKGIEDGDFFQSEILPFLISLT